MFKDLSINLGASVIYDFAKKISKKEAVQYTLKKLGAIKNLSDFPERYTETLVELRVQEKPKEVLNFFRDEDVMKVLYDFYYAPQNSDLRNNNREFYKHLDHLLEARKIGDDIKSANINLDNEIVHFRKIFKQKIQESRTVSETEFYQLLNEIRKTSNSNAEILEILKRKGIEKVVNQKGEIIYNIGSIDHATFNIIIQNAAWTPRKQIGVPPAKPAVFIGRDESPEEIHQRLNNNKGLLCW